MLATRFTFTRYALHKSGDHTHVYVLGLYRQLRPPRYNNNLSQLRTILVYLTLTSFAVFTVYPVVEITQILTANIRTPASEY